MSDQWLRLRTITQARIGLSRHGHAIGTKDLLDFQLAHAAARDAVHQSWDVGATAQGIVSLGDEAIIVSSQVTDRLQYLQRPDLGRLLNPTFVDSLKVASKDEPSDQPQADIAIIVTDGLSAGAIEAHFVAFWSSLKPMLANAGLRHTTLVLVPFGRVGLSDAIGEVLNPKLTLIFVGERPGLSSTDSMGIYLTYGRSSINGDAGRNCISNVRPPHGLGYKEAAAKLMFLVTESLRLKISGVDLKENASGLQKSFGRAKNDPALPPKEPAR